jgi:CRP-like cAMP-binding protein
MDADPEGVMDRLEQFPRVESTAGLEAQTLEQSRLLRSLPAEEYAELRAHLEPVELSLKQVLWQPEAHIHSVYFPRTAVMSLLTPLASGFFVEAATVGCEGLVGTPVALGARNTSVQAIVQIAGTAARLEVDRFMSCIRASDCLLLPMVLRYTQALHEQTAQSVACNRRHDVSKRCARWILMTQDRVGESRFPLTHQLLSIMLGVRRASVTEALGELQAAGLITTRRTMITVRDRAGLEAASCECYGVVRRRYDHLLDSGRLTH